MMNWNWERFQSVLPNFKEIASWDHNCNLAMATGSLSGVVVVDCESIEDAQWFRSNRGDSPLQVKTPRGVHLWFRHPGGYVKNAQRVPDESGQQRYDVRGDGGYVLLPPSKVVANGKDVKISGDYKLISPLENIKKIPVFQREWRPETTPQSGNVATRGPIQNGKKVTDGPAYIKHIYAVSGKGGHSETFRAANILRESGMTRDEALMAFSRWNETNAIPPWSDKELAHKIDSAFAKGDQ